MQTKPRRKRISADVEVQVLDRCRRRCALCYTLSGDLTERLGQIAHLDNNRTNDREDNLAFLCMDHHSVYDSTTSQHKNYSIQEVKTARNNLYKLIGEGKHLSSSTPEAPLGHERLIELRIAAIKKLHECLVEGHYELNKRALGTGLPQTIKEFKAQVEVHEFKFFNSYTMAMIYLDAETEKSMGKVLGSFRQMVTSIWLRIPTV